MSERILGTAKVGKRHQIQVIAAIRTFLDDIKPGDRVVFKLRPDGKNTRRWVLVIEKEKS